MKFIKPFSLKEIGILLECKIIKKIQKKQDYIYGISDFFSSSEKDIIVLNNLNYLKYLKSIKANTVVLKEKYEKYINKNCIISENPRLELAKIINLCFKSKKKATGFIKSIFIGKNCIISKDSEICGNVSIGENTIIKMGTFLSSNVIIEDNCIIGNKNFIESNSVIKESVETGNRNFIGSNSTIGNTGFGFVKNKFKKWKKIIHLKSVKIGNDVNIGNNTVIDKGVLLNTIISQEVLIDSNVQIAHNVFIGNSSVVAGCSGIAGGSYIGKECMMGGGVLVSDHIFINNNIFITGSSTVIKSITDKGLYSSTLHVKKAYLWNKNLYYINKIIQILKKQKKIINKKLNKNS